jgi:hypothetical protein
MGFVEYSIVKSLAALGGFATFREISNHTGLKPRVVWGRLCRLDSYVEPVGAVRTNNNGGSKLYRLTGKGQAYAEMNFQQVCRRGDQ